MSYCTHFFPQNKFFEAFQNDVFEPTNAQIYFDKKWWRLEKFSNREFLRWEKVAELFYAPERENSQQNSSLIRIFLLNSNAQDFWFCETQFCSEKDLNRNLAIQEGAKILFTSKSTCKSPSSI